jgi:putative ABC transport system substrate-binding protein
LGGATMKTLALATILALGLLAAPLAAEGQQAGKVPRIAVLLGPTNQRYAEAFREGMRDLGWVHGQNITIETSPNPPVTPSSDWTAEVLKLNFDVVVGSGAYIAMFARQAPSTVSVVMAGFGDPVAAGFAKTLARPGGNVTGLVSLPEVLNSKRLQLLKESFPKISRVAHLDGTSTLPPEVETAARALKVTLLPVKIDTPERFENAFSEIKQQRVDALFVNYAPFFWTQRRVIIEFAARQRLPAVYPFAIYAESGGLISYGAEHLDIYRRAATYVDKILKGARPGDLPIEQPTKFELVINLKTAKTLGLTLPQSVLLRADQVIE